MTADPRPRLTEAGFQRQVIDLARTCGWLCAHFRPAVMRSGRWATPVEADATGFPDLVLVRGRRLIFAELKSERGRLEGAQERWLNALQGVASATDEVTAVVWRPSDWDEIQRVLTGRETTYDRATGIYETWTAPVVVPVRPEDDGTPAPEGESWCMGCRARRVLVGTITYASNGQRMAKGKCPECGCGMARMLPRQ